MSCRRVVLRVHDRWLDDYRSISDAWFSSHGHDRAGDDLYEGIFNYDVRVAFVGAGGFHIVIDYETDAVQKLADTETMTLDVYRVRRGCDGAQM